jgi:hypothetical protein
MKTPGLVLPLLVFEAAGCLMALPASEVAHLHAQDAVDASGEGIDLGEYFTKRRSDGPWLHWGRGELSRWLRVDCVVDVVPVDLSALSPMPKLLRGWLRARAFCAAGVRGDDVFLLLDPARLRAEAGPSSAGPKAGTTALAGTV